MQTHTHAYSHVIIYAFEKNHWIIIVERKWFMGQTHLPRENPKAQAEEDHGPSSTR